jgi:DNA-binding FrmR family transcriptional regulator
VLLLATVALVALGVPASRPPPPSYPPQVGRIRNMKDEHRRAVVNRLKTARGHLDAVIRMVDEDTYCPDVMKQLSAVQGSLERASRLVLRNHLETCVAAAMVAGRTSEIVDELMEALRYDRITTGPGPELELSGENQP